MTTDTSTLEPDVASNGTASAGRRRRPELPRQAPLRHVGGLLREGAAPAPDAAAKTAHAPAASSASSSAQAPASDATQDPSKPFPLPGPSFPLPPSEDPVARGVRLGYEVIEEQIAQGQKLAQRLGRAASSAASQALPVGAGEAAALVDRVVELYRDVGTLCLDAVEGLLRRAPAAAAPGSGHAAHATPAPAAAGPAVVVEVQSARRTRVAVDLRPPAGVAGFVPHVHALHGAGAGAAALTGLRFSREPSRGDWLLSVEVPAKQPAGLYSGLIVDATSNQPAGTVSVTVAP